MIFPNCERKKKLIHLLIVKKICLERTQYAFLDHPKTLVFLVTSSNYTHARALTPFIPIPRAPKKPSYSALRSAQKEDTEDKFLTRHWMLRCTRAPFGTFMKVFFRVWSGVVHYQWDARRLWNIRAMILLRSSDSETVALTLFRSNMASKPQNYLQLSSSLVVVSDDLLLCLLELGEKIACFAFYPFPRT